METACAIVLAAGKSTRMVFNKLTYPVAGHAMAWYAVDHLRKAGLSRIIVVIGHDRTEVKQAIGGGVEWAIQEEQRGTGHAVAQAVPLISSEEHVVVLYGDCPFLDSEIIRQTISTHLVSQADVTFATAKMKEPRFLGRIIRGSNGIVEKVTEASETPLLAGVSSEVFTGLSVWKTEFLRSVIYDLPIRNRGAEREEQELPDAVELARQAGRKVATFTDISEKDALGPNEPDEFDEAAGYMQVKVKARLRAHGVILLDSHTIRADYDVAVGSGSILRSNTHLLGATRIGANCEIGPDVTLTNCEVGDRCVIGRGSWRDQVFPAGSKASDRLATEHRYFRRPHFMIPEGANRCFVIMPFKDPYLLLLRNVIRPAIEGAGFTCDVVSERFKPGSIVDDIWEGINRARLVIAELSEANKNVWYELGLAHALNKHVIPIAKKTADISDIPFDIRHQRLLIYDPETGDLRSQLDQWLKDVRSS